MPKLDAKSALAGDHARGAYRADIDGLRAIAVLAVLFFHAGLDTFRGGFTGVDVFFVISGFLIGGHIFAEETSGKFRFATFYQRRAKRILPALFVVLLATLLLGSLLLSPYELRHLGTEAVATLLSASNIYYRSVGGYFAGKSDQRPLLMTWSLGVEEQFYIFVPILMVLVLRAKRSLWLILCCIAVASFAIATYQVAHLPESAFYLLPGRAWELLTGVLLAVPRPVLQAPSRRVREVLGILGALALLGPIFLLSASVRFPGPAALPSVLGAGLLLLAEGSWVNNTVLSWKPLRFVGRISYSLYLWHWPLLSTVAIVLGTRPPRAVALAVLAVAFVIATGSYFWIEQPFRRSRMPAGPLLVRYAAVSLLLIGVFAAVHQTYGLRFRAPALAREDELEADKGDACQVTDPASAPNRSAFCMENSGKPALALWGDSHASTLANEVRTRAHAAGFDLIEAVKTACPPLQNTGRFFTALPTHGTECIAFNDQVLKALVNNPRVKAVVLASNWKASFFEPYSDKTGWILSAGANPDSIPTPEATAQTFETGLVSTIQALQHAGKQVTILQDGPSFAVEPAWRWHTARQPLRRWIVQHMRPEQSIDPLAVSPDHVAEDQEVRRLIQAAGKATGASVVDLERDLCSSPQSCRYRNDQHFFFRDEQHLSTSGAQQALGDWLNPQQASRM